jgi:hypothetical protein
MFCDLVGSTAMSARLDPEDMRGIIGTYQKCCASLIEGNGSFAGPWPVYSTFLQSRVRQPLAQGRDDEIDESAQLQRQAIPRVIDEMDRRGRRLEGVEQDGHALAAHLRRATSGPERLWRSRITQSDMNDSALAPRVHSEAAALKDT